MLQILSRNWPLALCGVLDAIFSIVNLFTLDPDGSLSLRKHFVRGTIVLLGKLALAAGACSIVAGLWSSMKDKSWLLVLYGLALSTLGLIFVFWRGALAFRTVALLLAVMALSVGSFAFANARTLRRHVPDRWFLLVSGAASIGFALAFLVLGFPWIRLEQPQPLNIWLSSYFAFTAICMLGFTLRLTNLRPSQTGQWKTFHPFGNPKHAH